MPLRTYLLRKLDLVDEANTSQLTLLCSWLTQIYMCILSESKDDEVSTPLDPYT